MQSGRDSLPGAGAGGLTLSRTSTALRRNDLLSESAEASTRLARSERTRLIECLIIVSALAALRFLPAAFSHFGDGEQYLSAASAIAGFDRIDAWAAYGKIAAHYRALYPGWFPLGPLPLTLWLVDSHLGLVKYVNLVLIVANFATFGFIAYKVFRSTSGALFASILALTAWQFRTPHDPVVGTSLLMPWLAELLLLAFAAWLVHREAGDLRSLAVASAALAGALLCSPAAWGFGLVLGAMALRAAPTRRAGVAFIALTVLAAAAQSTGRVPAAPWERVGAYDRTVFAQLLAAVPTSYRAFGHLPVGHVPALWHGSRFVDDRFINVPGMTLARWITVLAVTFATARALFAPFIVLTRRTSVDALVVGGPFWLFPAVAPTPALWLRHGLQLGQALDTVYLEYFGIAILGTLFVWSLRSRTPLPARLVPALAILDIFLLGYGNERADAVALARSARVDETRAQIERAAAAGFFAVLPEGSTIAIPPSAPFAQTFGSSVADFKYTLFHYAQRRFNVIADSSLRTGSNTRDAWLLRTSPNLGAVVSLTHAAGTGEGQLLADRGFAFAIGPDATPALPIVGRGVRRSVTELRDGRLIAATRTCGPVAADRVFAASQPALLWKSGFYDAGPYGYRPPETGAQAVAAPPVFPTMFMSSRAVITLVPTMCPPGVLTLVATAVAGAPGTLTIREEKRVDRIAVSPNPVSFSLRYVAHSRTAISIHLIADAPVEDLDPLLFRYERDKPRALRLALGVATLVEEPHSAGMGR